MNVDQAYSIMKYALAKNISQGYFSPVDFGIAFNSAQKSYTAYLLGNFQTYNPGRPISKTELGQNAVVRQRLSPVIYGYILDVDTTGFSPYPGDYIQSDAMWSLYGFQRIRLVEQDQLYSVYNSVIDPIASNPIHLIEDVGFRFYPQSISNARLSYVRTPPDVVWGYDLDMSGRPVYNPLKSTQPVWADDAIMEIITRALKLCGVNLQLSVVVQYAQDIIKTGQ